MFGFIMTSFVALGKLINSLRIINENETNKEKSKLKGNWTYVDHKGAIRQISNDEYLNFHNIDYDHKKDYCAFDSKGNIIRNLTEENRDVKLEKNKKLAKENGNTVFYDPRGYYIDFKTGEKCLPYFIGGLYYFINLDTQKIMRLADCETVTKHLDNNYEYRNNIYKKYKDYYDKIKENEEKELLKCNNIVYYINKNGKGSDFTIPKEF